MDGNEQHELDTHVRHYDSGASTGAGIQCRGLTLSQINLSQLSTLTHTFLALVKDKEIIASEVMHEYDEKVQ